MNVQNAQIRRNVNVENMVAGKKGRRSMKPRKAVDRKAEEAAKKGKVWLKAVLGIIVAGLLSSVHASADGYLNPDGYFEYDDYDIGPCVENHVEVEDGCRKVTVINSNGSSPIIIVLQENSEEAKETTEKAEETTEKAEETEKAGKFLERVGEGIPAVGIAIIVLCVGYILPPVIYAVKGGHDYKWTLHAKVKSKKFGELSVHTSGNSTSPQPRRGHRRKHKD